MSDPKVPRLLDDDARTSETSRLMRMALRRAKADVPDAGRVEALSRSIAGAVGGAGRDGGGDGGGAGGAGGAGAAAGAGALGATKLLLGGAAVIAAVGVGLLATRGGAGANADANADASASAKV